MQQFYTENEGEIAQENVDQHVCRCVYLCNACRGRGREEWEACPLKRAVYFVCSTAALAYAAARTVRMINMRGLLVQCLPPLYVIYDEICQTANTLSTHRHTHTHLSTHMNNLMNVNSTHEFALLAFLFNLSQRQRERERQKEKESENCKMCRFSSFPLTLRPALS